MLSIYADDYKNYTSPAASDDGLIVTSIWLFHMNSYELWRFVVVVVVVVFVFDIKIEPWISRLFRQKSSFSLRFEENIHKHQKSRLFQWKCLLSMDFQGKTYSQWNSRLFAHKSIEILYVRMHNLCRIIVYFEFTPVHLVESVRNYICAWQCKRR